MSREYLKIALFLWVTFPVFGKRDTLIVKDDSDYSPLFYWSEIYTSSSVETINEVRKKNQWQTLTKEFQIPGNQTVWIRFYLKNPLDTSQQYFIRNPDNEISDYYIFGQRKKVIHFRNGEFVSTLNMNETGLLGVGTITIAANETVEVYIKASNHEGVLPFLRVFPQKNIKTTYALLNQKRFEQWLNNYYAHNLEELQVRTFYQGALGIIMAIAFLIFYRNRQEKIYKYYLLYVLSAFAFTLFKSRSFTYIGQLLGLIPIVKFYAAETIMWLGFAVYLFFVAELLDLNKTHPDFQKFLHRLGKIFTIYSLSIFAWLLLTNDSGLQKWLFNNNRIPLFLFYAGILIYIARNVRSSMVKYLIIGNVLLIVFGMIAWLKAGILNHQHWYGVFNHLFTLPLAILLEIIVFALAIAKKIEEERNVKTELEQKTMQVEMMALRSQMNPHFLFNSLNSIRYMVMVNDNENATDYLSKFSKLLRMILNHSEKNVIRLSEELVALRLYLDIEKRRFGDNFNYAIMIDEQIEIEALQIPPMLLQPFVENAIWHGLMPSTKADKRIEVFVKKINDSMVEFLIKDNGVGRLKANELKQKSMKQHQSKGTDITNQRVELFNRNYLNKINITINDLHEHNISIGTMVRVLYEL
ncbi:histidine kinase [Emticicia sp. BO119]|uniref:histidine kinase n=1 Tax=Emticicia sp. BO119 TaxID=2757768 RepID=UPI0015F0CBFB|nr:histidine kinase [Emticicia sp. BO119]MBA4848956.1 histidine kinase [Emticicia sp. BO119]